MKKVCHKNIQRQVTSLIPIVELYITLIAEVEQTLAQLNVLPGELSNLQKQSNLLRLKSFQNSTSTEDLELQLQQTEFILDSLVDDLDEVSTNLVTFESKLKDVIVLKERLEALQIERINGLTPERIYKLLEKHQQRSLQSDSVLTKKEPNTGWQKLGDLGHKLRERKIVTTLAIVASLSLGWIGGYHSSINVNSNGDRTVETTEETNNS